MELARDTFTTDEFVSRQSLPGERDYVRVFVCDTHVKASSFSEESMAAQIRDLPTDFPELFDEEEWGKSLSWVVEPIFQNEEQPSKVAAGDIVAAIGLTFSSKTFLEGKISYFFVSEKLRRKGIGRRLLKLAISEATSRGCFQLKLLTLRGVYDGAIVLYKQEGFSVESEEDSPHYRLVHMIRPIADQNCFSTPELHL